MMQSTSCERCRDLRQLPRHRRTRHDMTTIDVFHCVTGGHSDLGADDFRVGDIAVKIASIDLCAEVTGDDGEWPESAATDPDHVHPEAIERRKWIHRGNEHVVAQRHGGSIPHQPCSIDRSPVPEHRRSPRRASQPAAQHPAPHLVYGVQSSG